MSPVWTLFWALLAFVAFTVYASVTRLDSRRKAGENVTVLRSVKP